jgi:hypothetical protein
MSLRSRKVLIALAMCALCAILAVDVVVLLRSSPPEVGLAASAASSSEAPPPAADGVAQAPAPSAVAGSLPEVIPAEGAALFDGAEAPKAPPANPLGPNATVHQASQRTCSTSSVDGLSQQIIAEVRKLDPNGFARVPRRPNLVADDNVFLYLNASARDGLLKVLDANKGRTMKINSALRTVAQQYLVVQWGAGKRCGVQLAALPGESNHETGLALDVAEPGSWRNALEAQGFRWMGKSDVVHFDYDDKRAQPRTALDVKAFQRLWNRHHPDDRIVETGRYDAATAQRLKKAPAAGFKKSS